MARWGLIVEQNTGVGRDRRMWSVEVIGHVDGTREDALAALRARAERYEPEHPYNVERRALYQERDGFLLVLDGIWQVFHCRFTVAEELFDSAQPPPPAPEAAPAPAPVRTARPWSARPPKAPVESAPPEAWDADVPERPSWLGRDTP
ncbi:hypothetical protein [Streptomyces sp. NBC_00454]|uniref:hypothetical protein n=1 Tax=Streptomyces sp. NBC_00454 TaxID=2975747 RepID=UPI00324C3AB7